MRRFWLAALFALSALGAYALTRALDDLVPDPPPPVEAIELDWSASPDAPAPPEAADVAGPDGAGSEPAGADGAGPDTSGSEVAGG